MANHFMVVFENSCSSPQPFTPFPNSFSEQKFQCCTFRNSHKWHHLFDFCSFCHPTNFLTHPKSQTKTSRDTTRQIFAYHKWEWKVQRNRKSWKMSVSAVGSSTHRRVAWTIPIIPVPTFAIFWNSNNLADLQQTIHLEDESRSDQSVLAHWLEEKTHGECIFDVPPPPPPLPQDTTNWHPSQKSKTSNARILGPPTSKSTSLFHGAFVWSGRSELFGLCSTRSCPQNSQRRLEFKHDGIWDVSLFRNSTTFKSTETLHPNKKKRNPPFTRLRYPRGSIVFIHGDLIHRGVEAEKHAQGPAFRVHTYNEPKHLKYIQQDGVEHSDNASQEVCGLSPTNTSPPFTNLRYFLPFGHGNGSRTATPKGANAMQNFPGTTK